MKFILINLLVIIYTYLILSIIGESFNPNKWNDIANFICIALEFGYFIYLFRIIIKENILNKQR